MTSVFITILNMSITASIVALAAMLVRVPLRKAPKVFSYALWGVVLFRLAFPFSIESIFSLMPTDANVIPQDIVVSQNPVIHTGIQLIDVTVNNALPTAAIENSVNPIHVVLEIAGYVWLLGFAALLVYAAIGYLNLKRRVYFATLVRDNIFESDRIKAPFVLGFIRPKIYFPVTISPEQHDYILKHEQTHIKRRDYIIKPFAFAVLALHWFNPVIWISYFLMSKDMEMSCDEAVLRKTNGDIRGDYSTSLLSLSVEKVSLLNPIAFAFGESNVKERVVNVLNFKKHSKWVVAVSFIAVALFLVGFTSNRVVVAVDIPNEQIIVTPTLPIPTLPMPTLPNENVERTHFTEECIDNALAEAYLFMEATLAENRAWAEAEVVASGNNPDRREWADEWIESRYQWADEWITSRHQWADEMRALINTWETNEPSENAQLNATANTAPPLTPAERAEHLTAQFEVYRDFGLTYNPLTDHLYFNGELVRYFEDLITLNLGDSQYAVFGITHFTENGTIDVRAIRDVSQPSQNIDGSTDPSGTLLGIEPFSQAEFDARDIDAILNPPQNSAYTSSGANASDGNGSVSHQAGNTAVADNVGAGGIGIGGIFAGIENFGITFGGNILSGGVGNIYYNGQLVRTLIEGNGTVLSSSDMSGNINVRTVRDSSGSITGVSVN